jgi:hypothetical protein
MRAQQYRLHISTNDLPFDGYDLVGDPVLMIEKKQEVFIGFFSGWDIVNEIAQVTLFESMTLTQIRKVHKISKEDILEVSITDEELKETIKNCIEIPFQKWLETVMKMPIVEKKTGETKTEEKIS